LWIAHLRDVLGDQTYESLARKAGTMTTAAMVTYAYDQIDQARTELERPKAETAAKGNNIAHAAARRVDRGPSQVLLPLSRVAAISKSPPRLASGTVARRARADLSKPEDEDASNRSLIGAGTAAPVRTLLSVPSLVSSSVPDGAHGSGPRARHSSAPAANSSPRRSPS